MKQLEFLKKTAELQRLSHAYIFSGNDIMARKEAVLTFVQFLNCKVQTKPCKKCRVCRQIANGTFPDFIRIEPTTQAWRREITIAQIRDIALHIQLGTWEADYKVILIEDADTMNHVAQSALLKSIEEPPACTIFVLLTQHPELLLQTIRSRAQELSFYTFPQPEIKLPRDSIRVFERLYAASYEERFAYAKKLADTPERVQGFLEELLVFTRMRLLEKIEITPQDKAPQERRTVAVVQEISYLTQYTNANVRLALEQLLLSL
ncbi:hypothetical protein IID24_04590 [Patescibacteria group bacterium]|nr:hypothetical protein [Patescibacteria group bacterium]